LIALFSSADAQDHSKYHLDLDRDLISIACIISNPDPARNIKYIGVLNTMSKYMCVICGFIYDEAIGRPEDGIPAGTKWEDLPLNWTCPDCGARKDDFEMLEL